MTDIIEFILDHFKITWSVFSNKKTKIQNITNARQAFYYISRNLTDNSLNDIGGITNKHHSTVLYGKRKVEKSIKRLKHIKEIMLNIDRELRFFEIIKEDTTSEIIIGKTIKDCIERFPNCLNVRLYDKI